MVGIFPDLVAELPVGPALARQLTIRASTDYEGAEQLLEMARKQGPIGVLGAALLQDVATRIAEAYRRDLIPQAKLTGEAMARALVRQLAGELSGAAQVIEEAATWLTDPKYIGGGTRAARLRDAAGSLRTTAEGYR